ncbi:MAG: hypothetical protein JKY65_20300, partial [Planctomycetes bacterium]|nr:hypothetical protein [Planctomycetota bacterium]
MAAVSATELWVKQNQGKASQAELDERNETLVLLQDDRAKLIDRTRKVLEELRSKGGASDDLLAEHEHARSSCASTARGCPSPIRSKTCTCTKPQPQRKSKSAA